MHGIIYLFKPKKNTKISFIMIGVSALFFGFLNILLKKKELLISL